jgi:autotransporter adhesin
MAIQIDFPSRTTGATQEDAYLLLDTTLDNKTKTGRVELAVWASAAARAANAKKINNVCIPVGATEEIGEDGNVSQLKWTDFAWQTGATCYTKIKTYKVMVDGTTVDLSTGTDC